MKKAYNKHARSCGSADAFSVFELLQLFNDNAEYQQDVGNSEQYDVRNF